MTNESKRVSFDLDREGKRANTHSGCSAGFAVPTLVRNLVHLERRLETLEVERPQATAFTAEEVALATARVAKVVIGL